jgi:Na+/glutamate symporter
VAGSNRGTRAGFKHGIASGLLAVAVGHHIAAKNPGNPEQRRKAARAAIGIATVGPVITGVAGSALRSTRLFQKSARALQGKTTALRHLAAMMQAKRALKTAKVASKFVM